MGRAHLSVLGAPASLIGSEPPQPPVRGSDLLSQIETFVTLCGMVWLRGGLRAKVLGRLGRKLSPHPRACALSCPLLAIYGPGSLGHLTRPFALPRPDALSPRALPTKETEAFHLGAVPLCTRPQVAGRRQPGPIGPSRNGLCSPRSWGAEFLMYEYRMPWSVPYIRQTRPGRSIHLAASSCTTTRCCGRSCGGQALRSHPRGSRRAIYAGSPI